MITNVFINRMTCCCKVFASPSREAYHIESHINVKLNRNGWMDGWTSARASSVLIIYLPTFFYSLPFLFFLQIQKICVQLNYWWMIYWFLYIYINIYTDKGFHARLNFYPFQATFFNEKAKKRLSMIIVIKYNTN